MKELTDKRKLEILKFLYGHRLGQMIFLYYIKGLGTHAIANICGYSSWRYVYEKLEKFEKKLLEEHKKEMIEKEFDRVFGRNVPERERFIEDNKLQQILYDNGIRTKKEFLGKDQKDLQYLYGVGKAILPRMLKEYNKLRKETQENISKLSKDTK